MKKRDRLLKKYLVVIIFIFCSFGLLIGITQAANKTSYLTKGAAEEIVTDKQISEYIINEFFNISDYIKGFLAV